MKDVAGKFKSIGQDVQSTRSSSSLFGDSNLSRAITVQKTRIGFYPIISEKQPETAMGIASCLAYLIEQHSEFRVYRVFAKVDNQSEESEITEKDYQFTPDEWEFAGLDDNVTMYGTMQEDNDSVTLKIHIDLNLTDDEEEVLKTFTYPTVKLLVSELAEVARQIVEAISETPQTELIITYNGIARITDDLFNEVLENVFFWNLDLYLYLWGVEWSDEDILDQYKEMISLSKSSEEEFVVWCVSMMARQVMQVGLDIIGEVIVPTLNEITTHDLSNDISSAILSTSLANMGYVNEAVEMVKHCKKNEQTSLELWFSIINVYLKANQFQQALENNQLAIELGSTDYRIYWMYHQLLSFAENNDIFVEELLLIDPDEIDENEQVPYEIIEALKAGLSERSDNQALMFTLLKYLIEVEHDELWTYFTKLLNSDVPEQQIRQIIESFYNLHDLASAFDILEEYKTKHPSDPNALLYLAQLELLDGQADAAKELLNQAIELINTDDPVYVEAQRLLLSATIDGFESRYADVLIMLDANKSIPEGDVDMLESALEVAPNFADIYVTLAKCYLQWSDTETAIEVLSDAKEHVGTHPRISQVNSQINWKRGDKQLALKQLNQALEESPNDIALLAQTARFLIENKQFEDSKRYIARAETIAPSHPDVWNLRKLITDSINQ